MHRTGRRPGQAATRPGAEPHRQQPREAAARTEAYPDRRARENARPERYGEEPYREETYREEPRSQPGR
ncbi:hypothetical protein AB0J68_14955, partial [Micromonospora sp. NPDC049580]|uniref:hypothetical protein n=1 Tax=Micromonospora sp. NPDC049580 TaxID=3154832 RepID=UPI0034232D76